MAVEVDGAMLDNVVTRVVSHTSIVHARVSVVTCRRRRIGIGIGIGIPTSTSSVGAIPIPV